MNGFLFIGIFPDLDGGGGPVAREVQRDDVLGGVAVGEVPAGAEADVHDGDAGDGLEEHGPEPAPVGHGRLQGQRHAEPLEAEHGAAAGERDAPGPRDRGSARERLPAARGQELGVLLHHGGHGQDGARVGEDAEVREGGQRADEGERGLDREQEREDHGGRRERAGAAAALGGEDGGDVLADEDEVGDGATGLGQDDGGLREAPADPAEALLAQVAVGVVATAMLVAMLLDLCFLLAQFVSAVQLHDEQKG
jgi:hypothetical protein